MRGRLKWYVAGFINGTPVMDGPFDTSALANKKAASINDWDNGDWEIKRYMTEDLSVAKSAWKSERAGETGSMAMSLRPVRSLQSRKKTRYEELREERGY